MQAEHIFDVITYGTSITELLPIRNTASSTLVVHNQTTYGTSYTIDGLMNIEYISNLKVIKHTTRKVTLEAIPSIFITKVNVISMVEYVRIKQHVYIDSEMNVYKIPYTVNELIDCQFVTDRDRIILGRLFYDKQIINNGNNRESNHKDGNGNIELNTVSNSNDSNNVKLNTALNSNNNKGIEGNNDTNTVTIDNTNNTLTNDIIYNVDSIPIHSNIDTNAENIDKLNSVLFNSKSECITQSKQHSILISQLSEKFISILRKAFDIGNFNIYNCNELNINNYNESNLITLFLKTTDCFCFYPIYGCAEISEAISRYLGAYKGVNFYLDAPPEIKEENGCFLMNTVHGKIVSSRFVKAVRKHDCCFRVLLYKKLFYYDSMFAVFGLHKTIRCLVLGADTKMCEKGCVVIYFWGFHEISDDDLRNMGVEMESVEMDLSFVGNSDVFMV